MTEQPIEQPIEQPEPEQPEPEQPAPAQPTYPDAPADAADDDATGWAVYDRALARFVGGVTTGKPSKAEARKLAGDHPHAIVRV